MALWRSLKEKPDANITALRRGNDSANSYKCEGAGNNMTPRQQLGGPIIALGMGMMAENDTVKLLQWH